MFPISPPFPPRISDLGARLQSQMEQLSTPCQYLDLGENTSRTHTYKVHEVALPSLNHCKTVAGDLLVIIPAWRTTNHHDPSVDLHVARLALTCLEGLSSAVLIQRIRFLASDQVTR